MSIENVAAGFGRRMAARLFDRRSKGRGWRTSEAHLSEAELASICAAAWEAGYQVRSGQGREPGEAFRWLVEIGVRPDLVADGIGLGAVDDERMWTALCRAFPMAECSGLTARVLDRPPLADVLREQGYGEAEIAHAVELAAQRRAEGRE